ncbi:MAG: Ig-like domain-containing protein, partial [Thermoanaerobaculia bacterium]|nr:Ig-like domain-containing protein [Thermoanaerobaculia bacterium]
MTTNRLIMKMWRGLALSLCLLLGSTAAKAQDIDPPVLQILDGGVELTDGTLVNRSVLPIFQVTDASPVTVDATLDGAPFASGQTVSSEGVHSLSVTATDDAGNVASASVGFEIDLTPPAFQSLLPTAGTVVDAASVTLSGRVVGSLVFAIDGQSVPVVGDLFSYGPTALVEGVNSWQLVATDAAGNSTSLDHQVSRDSTAPSLSISLPASGALVDTSSITVSGSVQDPHLSSVTVNGTNATLSNGAFTAHNVPLSEGENTLRALATDQAGHQTTVQRTITLDSRPPVVAITDPASGTLVPGDEYTVRGSASDAHLESVAVNGVAASMSGGSWIATVPLPSTVNTLTAIATDSLGATAEASVTLLRDPEAPEIHIQQPSAGSLARDDEITVSGTVETLEGVTVTVNGLEAVVTGSSFSGVVPLIEGENRLIARAISPQEPEGPQGVHTVLVYRDTEPPSLTGASPSPGSSQVPVDATLRLYFDEEVDLSDAGAWSLKTSSGASLPASATQQLGEVTVAPTSDLPTQASIALELTSLLRDQAGNPLANPQTLTFTTLDGQAPSTPSITPLPAQLCASRVPVAGLSEAGSRIRITGGGAAAEGQAAADGTFSLLVDLLPSGTTRLEIWAEDPQGNASPSQILEIRRDCLPPQVLTAESSGTDFSLDFSEVMDGSSVAEPGVVQAFAASGLLTGTTSVSGDGLSALHSLAEAPPEGAVRLEVSQAAEDLAGNALAFPFSRVFGGSATSSFLSGRAVDSATGRPLEGVLAIVVATDGVVNPDPQPQQTAAADGRFQVAVAEGTHYLTLVLPGYTPVFRLVTASSGSGVDVFDPRLTPIAPFELVPMDGGVVDMAGGGELSLPAGSLVQDTQISVTALDEQALPALLPLGWSPRGAAWVQLGSGSLTASASLDLPVNAPSGTTLTVARLDLSTASWIVVTEVSSLAGRAHFDLDEAGAYVALEADSLPVAPPSPVPSQALGSAAPTDGAVLTAEITFDPVQVRPSQTSRGTITYTLSEPTPSGLPLTVEIREQLTLLDGSSRNQPPYSSDFLLYHDSLGTPASHFNLRPSLVAQTVPVDIGVEDLEVSPYAGATVQGNVIGPVGGTVSNADGDRVEIPAGALAAPAAVTLQRLTLASLPLEDPVGLVRAGAVELDLGGQELDLAADLSLDLGAAPTATSALLLQILDLNSGPVYRAVATLAPTSTGWTTEPIDVLDLPWPGVRTGGTFVFTEWTVDHAYLRGHVFDSEGLPVQEASIWSDTVDWIQISDSEGRYAFPAPLGALTLSAEDLFTGNLGSAATTLSTPDERVDLDLQVEVSGPTVVAVTPADGSPAVIAGIEPTVRFSEPVDVNSLTLGIQLLEEGIT